eukprot:EG_transcript_5091
MLSAEDGRDAVVDLLLEDQHFANLDADYQRSRRVETFNSNFRAHHQLRHKLPDDDDPKVVVGLIYYFFHFMCKISRGQITTLRVRRVLNLLKRTVRRILWLHHRRRRVVAGIVEMWKREEEVLRERVNQLAQRNQVEQAKAHAHRIAQSCFPEDVKRVIITDMYFEKNRKFGAVFVGWLRRLQTMKQKVTHADREYKRLIMHGHEMHFSMMLTHASSVLMSAKAELTRIESERPTWHFTQHSVTLAAILEYVEEWTRKSALMQAPLAGGFLNVDARALPPTSPRAPRSPRLSLSPLDAHASSKPVKPLGISALSPRGSIAALPVTAASPRRPLTAVREAAAQPGGRLTRAPSTWLESSPGTAVAPDAAGGFSPRMGGRSPSVAAVRRNPSVPEGLGLARPTVGRQMSSLVDPLDFKGRPPSAPHHLEHLPGTPGTPTISLCPNDPPPAPAGVLASSPKMPKLSPLRLPSGPVPTVKSPRSAAAAKGGGRELSAIPSRMHSLTSHREPATI